MLYDVQTVNLLPVLIKTQLLQNITRRGNRLTFVGNMETIVALLHKDTVKLDLSAYRDVDDYQLRSIVAAAPNIRELCIVQPDTDQFLDYKDLLACVANLPYLRALHVQSLDGVTDELIFDILRHCKEMEVLDVANCRNLSDGCGMAVRCIPLKKLNVSHTKVSRFCCCICI